MSRSGGGGTKRAFPGRLPPIQFCDRRNSPGSFSASPSGEEHPVDFPQEPEGDRKSLGDPGDAKGECADVVRHLLHVVERHAGSRVGFEEQQVGERRLRALDLGREHRFLAHVGVEKECGLRQQEGDSIEPADGHRGLV
jgi:hypothetical protein